MLILSALCKDASAVPISIVNAGFESTVAPINSYGPLTPGNNPGGWTSTNGAGYIGYPPTFSHSGSFGGYIDPAAILTNTLGSTWAAGTYTFNGYASPETSSGRNVAYSLLSGSSVVGTKSMALSGAGNTYVGLAPLVVTIEPGDPEIGSPITVAVSNATGEQPQRQLYVDDFSLDFSATTSEAPDHWREWRQSQQEFPVAAWSYWINYPATTAQYQIYADAGMNMVQAPLGSYFNSRAAGLKGWIGSWENLALDPQKLAAYIDYPSQDHDGVTGYMLFDEPEPDRFASLAAAVQTIYDTDTRGAIPMITLLPNWAWESNSRRTSTWGSYRNYVESFADTVKPPVLAATTYPVLADGTDRTDYYSNLELIREVSLDRNIGMMGFVLNTGLTLYRDPSESDLRWQVYSNLAYGAKGIWWYNYRIEPSNGFRSGMIDHATGEPTPVYGQVQAINAELAAIGRELLKLQSVGVYHTGASLPSGTSPFWVGGEPGDLSALNNVVGNDFLIGEFVNDDDLTDTSAYLMLVNKRHGAGLTSDVPLIANKIAFTVDSQYGYVYLYSPSTGDVVQLGSHPLVELDGVSLMNAYTIDFTGGQGCLLRLSETLLGDFDNDGDVDGTDFLAWQRGGSPEPLSNNDFAFWKASYGAAVEVVVPSGVVPEPGCSVMLVLGWSSIASRLSRVRSL